MSLKGILQRLKIRINMFFRHRQELLDRRTARHLRKQQLAKRRTAASQVISSCDVI